MKEEYLHYLFRTKQLGNQFITTSNLKVEILDFGIHNHNSGPDFLECKISLNNKIWAGQIEFHIKSSDWLKHKHQHDLNYNNVILHVVFEHDQEIKSGEYTLPTIELKHLIDHDHHNKYKSYLNSKNWIACQNDIKKVDEFLIYQQKEVALLKRLKRKSNFVIERINEFSGNQIKVFYILLFKAFGTKVNQIAFQQLGEKFDYKILAKLNFNKTKIQAYLFGLAGFLNDDIEDEYYLILKNEFGYIKKVFDLNEMKIAEWKFSTMRSFNLPTVRLAQLTELLVNNVTISINDTVNDIREKCKIDLSVYWQNHYMFGRKGKNKNSNLTNSFIDLLFINVFIPYLFALGRIKDDEKLKLTSFNWLENLGAESNGIIAKWNKLNIKSKSAFDTQALIEQKNEYCDKNKCLKCKVGLKLLNCKTQS